MDFHHIFIYEGKLAQNTRNKKIDINYGSYLSFFMIKFIIIPFDHNFFI